MKLRQTQLTLVFLRKIKKKYQRFQIWVLSRFFILELSHDLGKQTWSYARLIPRPTQNITPNVVLSCICTVSTPCNIDCYIFFHHRRRLPVWHDQKCSEWCVRGRSRRGAGGGLGDFLRTIAVLTVVGVRLLEREGFAGGLEVYDVTWREGVQRGGEGFKAWDGVASSYTWTSNTFWLAMTMAAREWMLCATERRKHQVRSLQVWWYEGKDWLYQG